MFERSLPIKPERNKQDISHLVSITLFNLSQDTMEVTISPVSNVQLSLLEAIVKKGWSQAISTYLSAIGKRVGESRLWQ